MTHEQQCVGAFMKAAGQAVKQVPALPSDTQAFLGINLIAEELEELRMSLYVHKDLLQTYDALCDLMYVTLWLANACGLDMQAGFAEVHRSNMTKFIDGHRDPETGKWKKGPSYSSPNLQPLLAQQIQHASDVPSNG